MYLHTLKAGLDANGTIVGWQHRIVGQSILAGTAFESMMVKDGIDLTSVKARRRCRTQFRTWRSSSFAQARRARALVALGGFDAYSVFD
jgi:hypothetical protein